MAIALLSEHPEVLLTTRLDHMKVIRQLGEAMDSSVEVYMEVHCFSHDQPRGSNEAEVHSSIGKRDSNEDDCCVEAGRGRSGEKSSTIASVAPDASVARATKLSDTSDASRQLKVRKPAVDSHAKMSTAERKAYNQKEYRRRVKKIAGSQEAALEELQLATSSAAKEFALLTAEGRALEAMLGYSSCLYDLISSSTMRKSMRVTGFTASPLENVNVVEDRLALGCRASEEELRSYLHLPGHIIVQKENNFADRLQECMAEVRGRFFIL
jgi:hypothetical protein